MSQNRLWLKLDKMFFGLSQDVYLCAVYIPPISSPHYDNDFISLEGEVSTFSSKGKIVLIGDFNSRTGQNPDFIEKDSSQINDFDGVDLLPPDYVRDRPFNLQGGFMFFFFRSEFFFRTTRELEY